MQIVSVIQDAFQEYQNEHSLILFSYGCNSDCYHCYNKETVTNPKNIIGSAIDVMEKHLTPMHTAVVFLGGEPTIHDKLLDTCWYVKNKLKLKTKIFTNGLLPDKVLEINAAGLCDAWSIDFKCISTPIGVLGINISAGDYIANIHICVESCRKTNVPIEIRTTCLNSINDNQIGDIQKYIQIRYPKVPHIIQSEFFPNENISV